MREKLVQADVIEAVLGLGPNLFYNSPMEACVVICRTKKPQARRGSILFIDAKNEVTRERAQSFLTQEHIEKIVTAYRDFSTEEGFCRVVSNADILANRANLNIALYIRSDSGNKNGGKNGSKNGSQEEGALLAEAIDDWESSSVTLRAAMDDLFSALAG